MCFSARLITPIKNHLITETFGNMAYFNPSLKYKDYRNEAHKHI